MSLLPKRTLCTKFVSREEVNYKSINDIIATNIQLKFDDIWICQRNKPVKVADTGIYQKIQVIMFLIFDRVMPLKLKKEEIFSFALLRLKGCIYKV